MRLIILTLWLLLSGGLMLQAQDDNGCNVPLALEPGELINTRPGIYIRNLPTRNGGIVEYLENSLTLSVAEGPVCAEGINWWRVLSPINYNNGWVGEREGRDGRFLIFDAEPDPETLCPTPLTLPPGTRTTVFTDVRVRQEPGLAGLVLTVAPAETEVVVVDGPVCVDVFNWWRVRVVVVGVLYDGWMAEGFEGQEWVEQPGLPSLEDGNLCGPPRPFTVGTRAYVGYNDGIPKNLRAAPGTDSDLLFTLVRGIGLEIIGGPVCANNMNWWQVRILSRPDVEGWLGEGGPGNFWIRRISTPQLR